MSDHGLELLTKSLSQEDLRFLLEQKIPEDSTLEYKEDLQLEKDSHKAELCKDVSALANSRGGVILVGIREDRKIAAPQEIVGIEEERIDDLIRRIMDTVRSGTYPPVRISVEHIPWEGNKIVLAIKVPESPLKPHWINKNSPIYRRFYIRDHAQVRLMDYDELKSSFLWAHSLEKEIKTFILERAAEVKTRNFLPLADGPVLLLHMIPVSLFLRGFPEGRIPVSVKELEKILSKNDHLLQKQTGEHLSYEEYTYEGIMRCWKEEQKYSNYSLFFLKNAVLEHATTSFPFFYFYEEKDTQFVRLPYIAHFIIVWPIVRIKLLVEKLSILPPFTFSAVLLGVKGATATDHRLNQHGPFNKKRQFKRNDIFLPLLTITEELAQEILSAENPPLKMQEALSLQLNVLYNSANIPEYMSFEEKEFKGY